MFRFADFSNIKNTRKINNIKFSKITSTILSENTIYSRLFLLTALIFQIQIFSKASTAEANDNDVHNTFIVLCNKNSNSLFFNL